MTDAIRTVLAGVAVLGIAACDQPDDAINGDGVYRGQLSIVDPRLDDGSAYSSYEIDLDAGEELDVTLQSADFDTYLRVEDASGTVIGEDDDSAGGTNSNLIMIAPSAGTYSIIASNFTPEEYGDYVLAIRRSMPDNVAGVFTGSLQPVDGKSLNANGYPTHEIAASAGTVLDIHLASGSFDTFLEVKDSNGNVVAEDDDGAGGTNSRVSVPVYDSETFTMLVRSYDDGESGPYTLIVREDAEGEAGSTRVERFRGELMGWNDRLADGTPYALHIIEASTGEELNVSMSSDAFDAYLQIWDEKENVYAEDDDSGGGLNAQLNFVVPTDGRYVIVANSIGEDATGSYDIMVRRSSIDDEIASGKVEVLTGMLSAVESQLADGTPMSSHEVEAAAGERLEVTMTTGAFDAYLLVFDEDDNKLSEDDDSGGGTNARLSVIAPEDGTYRIVANSYSEDTGGQYTITVRRD